MLAYDIRDDDHGIGKVLIPRQAWSDQLKSLMLEQGIEALRLSHSEGFREVDLTFLHSLPDLRSLEVYVWAVRDVGPIERLTRLQHLGLEVNARGTLDCASLASLRSVGVTWKRALDGLLYLPSLTYLNVVNYPYADLTPLKDLQSLRKLYLTSRKLQSLAGIDALSSLQRLDLYNCPFLESLAPVEQCSELIELDIQACKHISRKRVITDNRSLSVDP